MTSIRPERPGMTLDEFFAGYEASRPLFDALRQVVDSVGESEIRVSKSQVAFARTRAFAWAWVPDRYLHGGHAPLVLSVALPCQGRIVAVEAGRGAHAGPIHASPRVARGIGSRRRRALLAAGGVGSGGALTPPRVAVPHVTLIQRLNESRDKLVARNEAVDVRRASWTEP